MLFNYERFVYTKRGRITAGVVLFVLLYVSLFDNILSQILSKSMLLSWVTVDDFSCYNSVKDDALPSADGGDFLPSPKWIFFLETSCRGNLTSRQWCAIESAARAHPDFQINVLFTAPIPKGTFDNIVLKNGFENVRFARIHIEEYAKNTPVDKIVSSGTLKTSYWIVEHASDLLRYLTLYKWGGIYLDFDVIVAKRLDALGGNWAARESNVAVAAGALAFSTDSIGRRMANETIREIQTSFRGDLWGHNGPEAITRVLKRNCNTSDVTHMTSATCQGFEVYGPELFYPIKWQKHKKYFKPGLLENKHAYIYHIWNHLTKNLMPHKYSPYVHLARRFCPTTYASYGNKFGM